MSAVSGAEQYYLSHSSYRKCFVEDCDDTNLAQCPCGRYFCINDHGVSSSTRQQCDVCFYTNDDSDEAE